MKSRILPTIGVFFILCISGVAFAQHPNGQSPTQSADKLREMIERLEKSDINSRSATVQDLYNPLPYDSVKLINLFGTALIKPTRTNITDPLILEPVPTGTTLPADNVFLQTVPQINRDYYRIGVGIDFISLISKWKALQK